MTPIDLAAKAAIVLATNKSSAVTRVPTSLWYPYLTYTPKLELWRKSPGNSNSQKNIRQGNFKGQLKLGSVIKIQRRAMSQTLGNFNRND